jgi:ribosomal protein L17
MAQEAVPVTTSASTSVFEHELVVTTQKRRENVRDVAISILTDRKD